MQFQDAIEVFPPTPALGGIVDHYEYVYFGPELKLDFLKYTPSFGMSLAFYFWQENPLRAKSDTLDNEKVPMCILLSPSDSPIYTDHFSRFYLLRVVFVPGMMTVLFDRTPPSEFRNLLFDTREVMDKQLDPVYDEMCATEQPSLRIWMLERYLLRKLRSKPVHASLFPHLARAAALNGHRPVTVQGLADDLGISRQHLNRTCKWQFGYGAKLTLQIHRFNRLMIYYASEGPVSLTRAAHLLGYHDQSHLTHEFRRFAGYSPREYLRSRSKRIIYGDVEDFTSSGMLLR